MIIFTRLYDVIAQKTVIFIITAGRSSNVALLVFIVEVHALLFTFA
jgi:hypothetical protein